ncbi:MAG: sulfurtransferase [Granulosicoccus sp.]|nr:sulfurtransferase [Granulosicoccus sp.]
MKKLAAIALTATLSAFSIGVQAADPLVDVDWVKANLGKPDVVFLDVRGKIAGKSKADYLRGHIPGAVYTAYLKDGWRGKDAAGTPGMLAPVEKLEALIGGLGIGNDTHVVIVPNGGKAVDVGTGTRIYWTLKVLGHDNVSLLDGGMAAYTKEIDKTTKKPVNPLEKGAVKLEAKTFKANLREEMLVTKDDVAAAQKAGVAIVDHRPHNQYLGINQHGAAKRPGTIPGAANVPENWLTKNGGGSFRSSSALEKLYSAADVSTTGEQINFCNSGHWASLGWFASHELLGNKDAKMYDGSMLEWSADESLPMELKVNLE